MNPKHLLLLLAVCLFTPVLQAQQAFTFGKINTTDLKLERHEADTTANALILYEKGDAKIRKDSRGRPALFFEHTVRVKIFNANGFEHATVQIPLHRSLSDKGRKEILEKAEAVVVNPDRTTGRIRKKDIFYEDVREDIALASFTLPNVQEGCVIDYRYTVRSPFFYNFQTWEFQEEIPKRYSEYNTSIPGNYTYNIKLYGPLKLSAHRNSLKRECFHFAGQGTADCSENTYIMENIPAFTEERYMTSKYNYLSALRFEMTTFQDFSGMKEHYTKSWKTVDRELKAEDIGRESQKEGWFKNNLPQELITGTPDKTKALAIYNFVKDHLHWNEKDHLFREFSVKDTWKDRSGSSTAINMALLNALKAGGFQAYPMLASSRANGFPSENIPAISDFNAMVVKLDIGKESYLLDAVNKNMPFGMIREKLLNQNGRVMDFKNGSYWYPLLQYQAYSKRAFQAEIDIEEATAQVREIATGYYALEQRDRLAHMSEEDFENELANDLEKRGDFTLVDFQNKGLNDPETGLVTTYELELNRNADTDRLLINPFILHAYTSNPFKLEHRTYPVDFANPFSIYYVIMIDMGDTYELESKPEDRTIKLAGKSGSLKYTVEEIGQKLTVKLNLDIYSPLIAPAHYKALKEFFNEFVSLQTQKPITLRRQLKDVSENAGK